MEVSTGVLLEPVVQYIIKNIFLRNFLSARHKHLFVKILIEWMLMKRRRHHKKLFSRRAFTLLEIILVIGIIGVLFLIVILSINPRVQLIKAQDARRTENAQQLENAAAQFSLDAHAVVGDKTIPTGEGNAIPVCRLQKSAAGCVNIDELLPVYVGCMPHDNAETNPNYSGFVAYQDSLRVHIKPAYLQSAASAECEVPVYPIAYWKFDELEIGKAKDFMINQFNATPFNFQGASGPSTDVPVTKFRNPRSINFDGANDYFAVATNELLDINRHFTISTWIYVNTSERFEILMRPDNGASNELTLRSDNGNSLELELHNADFDTSPTDIPNGQWVHLAAVRNNTSIKLYINGSEAEDASSSIDLDFDTCTTLYIGANSGSQCGGTFSDFFHGRLDDLRVYNIALSPAQIQNLANGYLW